MHSRREALRRIAPFLIVLFGFAMRVHAMDTTWIDGDRANPHGIGLLIVDSFSKGELSPFLVFNDDASTTLPNPPLIGYVWAAVSLFERSLFSATAFGLIVHTLAIAMTYALGRRYFGWVAGMLAAALIAASNWGVYLARGMWHPGQLEIGVVLSAWLLATGVGDARPRRLFWGFVAVILTAGAYFGALFMPFQAAIATLAARAWSRPLRRAWIAGAGVCAAGLAVFVLSMLLTGRLSGTAITGVSLFRREAGVETQADLLARDITPMNREPIGHFLRLASNADYAVTWTDPLYQAYDIRLALSQVVGWVISGFIVLGLARMLRGWRRPVNRFLLLWAALPVAALLVIAALKWDFRVAIYYLLMTSPVPYLAGGLGLALIAERLPHREAVTLLACGLVVAIPTWNFGAAAETVYRQPFTGHVDFMPLRWSQALGRLWQRECARINGSNFWWDLSLIQSPERWRSGGTRFNDFSSIWTSPAEGGTCALEQSGAPLANATALPLALDDGSVVNTYRSLPYPVRGDLTTTVNLGWTLLDYAAPERARAGDTISVTHAWRVDTLPSEPHGQWYFAPFIKLIAPDGRTVVDIDRAVALEGWEWRPGEVMVSAVQMKLPDDLPAGTYALRASLFDPNQKKNAVYFNAAQPGKPILMLERSIRVER